MTTLIIASFVTKVSAALVRSYKRKWRESESGREGEYVKKERGREACFDFISFIKTVLLIHYSQDNNILLFVTA